MCHWTSLTCDQAIFCLFVYLFVVFFYGAEKVRLIQLFVNSSASVPPPKKKNQTNKQTNKQTRKQTDYSSLAGLHPGELSVTLWLAKLYIAGLLLLRFVTWPFEGSGFFARPKLAVLVLWTGFSLRIQELGRIKRSAKTARKVGNHSLVLILISIVV